MSGFITVPQALSTLIFETRSLFDLGLAKYASLAGQYAAGIHLSLPP